MAKVIIKINNLSALEEYLNAYDLLEYSDLAKNMSVKGVSELIYEMPFSLKQKAIQKFYKKTGLKLQVQLNNGYDLTFFDRKGRYPREDASIFNEEFINAVDEHPEWLAPQEEPDLILVIYMNEMDEEPGEEVDKDWLPFN